MLSVVLGAAALVSIFLVWRDVRRGGLQLNSSGWFLFAIGWLPTVARGVGLFTGRLEVSTSGTQSVAEYSGLPQLLNRLTLPMLMALAVIVLLRITHKQQPLNTSILPFVAVSGMALISNLAADNPAPQLSHIAALLVLLATSVLTPGPAAVRGGAIFGASYMIASGLLALVNPSAAFAECTRKCSVFGVISTGLLDSGNAAGLTAVLSIPFVWISMTGPLRYWLTVFGSILVLASGSRSAIFALVTFLFAAVVSAGQARLWKAATMGSVLLIMTAWGVAVPFTDLRPDEYSERGYVWSVALDGILRAPLFGQGPNSWQSLQASGTINPSAAYSAHNLWLDTLYIGGIVGLLLLLLGFWLLLRRCSRRADFLRLATVLTPVLATASLERPISMTTANWLLFVLPGIALSSYTASSRSIIDSAKIWNRGDGDPPATAATPDGRQTGAS